YSSSSDPDPSEDSLPPVPDLPLVSPFLCSDDSEADDESKPAEQRPERHESLTIHDAEVSRWRDGVASRSSTPSGPSSHDILAPSFEFPLAPIVALLGIRRHSMTLIRPSEAIPFGRPYHTYLNGPRNFLTTRKRVRPLPAHRLAWRSVSHHSLDHHSSPESSSSSSSSDPSSVHSSACDSSGSSSERSLDSSSPSSRPSRKRCRSPTASVPSSTHVLSEDEHMEVGTADAETVANLGISDGVSAPTKDGLDMGVEVVASDIREDEDEFEAEAGEADTREIAIDLLATRDISESTEGDVPDHGTTDGAVDITYEILGDLVQRFHDHAEEILVHRIQVIESVQRFQGHRITRVNLGVTTMTERLSVLEQDNVRLRDTLRREKEAMVAYEEACVANALEAENQSQNGSDCDNGNDGNGNGGNGNGGTRNGRNENPNENGRGDRIVAR
ncbi:hypothetical protein Tco_1452818, partial [Tanacetum coccineum]